MLLEEAPMWSRIVRAKTGNANVANKVGDVTTLRASHDVNG